MSFQSFRRIFCRESNNESWSYSAYVIGSIQIQIANSVELREVSLIKFDQAKKRSHAE